MSQMNTNLEWCFVAALPLLGFGFAYLELKIALRQIRKTDTYK